jgi:Zn-dependent M28 family amino/carboxypeptidase
LAGSFACGLLSNAAAPTFDGDNAYQYLIKQCDFGARVPGTPAHRACRDFLTKELQGFGAQVVHQTFLQKLPLTGQSVTLTNIVASFGVDQTERVLLCAHWDSRPLADHDPEPANRSKPVPGANDGAAGVAVLLETARRLQRAAPRYGVDIIFFDGEDAGQSGRSESYALGAQYFADNKDPNYRPRWGILLDLVGDRDLEIYQEEYSLRYAPELVEMVWQRAARLGLPAFIAKPGYEVADDHLPLLRAGLPCIDVIDFNYRYWHTSEDTPDKCSPASLAQVGQLILSLIYEK